MFVTNYFQFSPEIKSRLTSLKPNFGYNGFSEFIFYRTYSRTKPDGTQESWNDCVIRVIEGIFSIRKDWMIKHHLYWSDEDNQKFAEKMALSMFEFKWLPPGRGLWAMGTPFVYERGSAALNNCSFCFLNSPKDFGWLMDMLMMGVGVGFSPTRDDYFSPKASKDTYQYVIPDSREGWVESVETLISAYFFGEAIPEFDYSLIRKAGEPIKGFGGVASGPEPLQTLHTQIKEYFFKYLTAIPKNAYDSVRLKTDIANAIGCCVVAGNVRRCLPENTQVQTISGNKNIQDVQIGELVSSITGWKKVVNKFVQGKQKLIRINHQDGYLDCTPNHKVAVLTGTNSYSWKEASELVTGDKLFYIRNVSEGAIQSLPSFTYSKPVGSTTCQDITIPPLDADMAWFLGIFLADGYVFANKENNGFNAYVSVTVHEEELELAEKIKIQFERFGVRAFLKKNKNERSIRIYVTSKQLAHYFYDNFKRAKTTLRVPEIIKQAKPEIRLAFVAGVFDGDGSAKTRPIQIVTTIYPEFAKDIQNLLYSVGIESRLKKLVTPNISGWKQRYGVSLITLSSQRKFGSCPQLFKTWEIKSKSQYCNGFTSRWITVNNVGICKNAANVTVDSYERLVDSTNDFVPIEVISIEKLVGEVETYDLEVEGDHCFIAEGVLVHNSAQIALGRITDDTFINLKNYDLNPERQSIGWMSNNSVVLSDKQDFEFLGKIASLMSVNGEPGLLNLRNFKYGRVGKFDDKQKYNLREDKALGINPCQPSYATVLTPEGIRTFADISIGSTIWSKDGWVKVVNKVNSGIKPVYKYQTNAGAFIGTTNHRIVEDGFKIEVDAAEKIDVLVGPKPAPGHLNPEIILDGLMIGDGSYHKASNNLLGLYIGQDDQDYFSSEVSSLIVKHRPGISKTFYEVITTLNTSDLRPLPERTVPEKYFYGSVEEKCSFLRGLFSANGSVVANRVSLKAVSKKLIDQVQLMLSSLGIRSYITTNRPQKVEFANGTYTCKKSYDLNISSDRFVFANSIGFIQKYKNAKLVFSATKKGQTSYSIVSKEYLEDVEVFDITVDGPTHTYWSGGLDVSNCGEIPLENYELCNLVETIPTKCKNIDDWFDAIQYATFYASTVSLLPTHRKETNAVIALNRRIGVSITDFITWKNSMTLHELTSFLRKGYDLVRAYNHIYNSEAGVPDSVRVTTVKPSGTLSKLASTLSGAHHPTFNYTLRRVRVAENSKLVPILKEANVPWEKDTYSQNTLVFEFPLLQGQNVDGSLVTPAQEVSIWEQVQNLQLLQREWSDNAVSITVYFSKDEVKHLETILSFTAPTIKSASFLPHTDVGAYPQMPEEGITEEEYSKRVSQIKPINWKLLSGSDGIDSKFCTNDSCEI